MLPTATPEVHNLDLEDLLSSAHRAKDLLTGAKASLVGPRADLGAATACNLVLEARAQLDSVIAAIEAFAARRAEAERAERQREAARPAVTR